MLPLQDLTRILLLPLQHPTRTLLIPLQRPTEAFLVHDDIAAQRFPWCPGCSAE